MAQSDPFSIRPATAADVPLILAFIRELAEYERLSHEATANEELLKDSLFGPKPAAEVILGYVGTEPVSFAIFFHNYSTFMGRHGLYLEDLYVKPEFRRRGLGRIMLSHLARLACERGCGRFEWAVLKWNQPAIDFYQSLGAQPLEDWTIFRLAGKALEKAGSTTSSSSL